MPGEAEVQRSAGSHAPLRSPQTGAAGRQMADTFLFPSRTRSSGPSPLIEEAERHLAEACELKVAPGDFSLKPQFSQCTLSGRAAAGPSGLRSCCFTNN